MQSIGEFFRLTQKNVALSKENLNHMRFFITFLILFLSLTISAQYTEVINSKRPGISESPFGVGSKVYQFESGIFYLKDDYPEFFRLHKSIGTEFFFRTGFISEKLEINANLALQKDKITQNLYLNNFNNRAGISQFTLGAKYLFYMPTYKDPSKEIRSWKAKMAFDWKRLIPSIGLYIGLNTNFLSQDFKKPSISPKASLLLQNDFSEDLKLITNIVGDYLSIKENRSLGYVTTFTYAITPRFSIFGEHQGTFTKYAKKYSLGGGVAYLFSKDLQLDLHARNNLQLDYFNLYANVGLSYRIDNHKDKLIRNKHSKDLSNDIEYKKEPFLKRIFKSNKRRGKPPRVKNYRKTRTRSKSSEAKRTKSRNKKENTVKEPRKRRDRRGRNSDNN